MIIEDALPMEEEVVPKSRSKKPASKKKRSADEVSKLSDGFIKRKRTISPRTPTTSQPKSAKLPVPQRLPGEEEATAEQGITAARQAADLTRNPAWKCTEIWSMAGMYLKVRIEVYHYTIRPARAKEFWTVAAALWARFKCRTIQHRDWALELAVKLSPIAHRTEGEVFAAASDMLDHCETDADFEREFVKVTGGRTWVPTVAGMVRQAMLGDREATEVVRLVNRPLADTSLNADYRSSHVTFLKGEGEHLYEAEVLGDGICWLRSILMCIPGTIHSQKTWDNDTGELLIENRTSAELEAVDPKSKSGAQHFGALTREWKAAIEGVAEFIRLNPLTYARELQRAILTNETEGMPPLPPDRVEFDFKKAAFINGGAEDYIMVNHEDKKLWFTILDQRYPEMPRPVKMLICCKVMTEEAAMTIAELYNIKVWELTERMGMVKVHYEQGTSTMSIGEFVSKQIPKRPTRSRKTVQ